MQTDSISRNNQLSMKDHQQNKSLVSAYLNAIDAADPGSLEAVIAAHTDDNYHCYAVYPFELLEGAAQVADKLWAPLKENWTALQRRQFMFMAGTSEIDQTDWVISVGQLMGLLDGNWLGIPATGKLTCLRYAEFHCVTDRVISRSAFFCDIIDVMQQAGVNPLPASTGAPGIWPAPRTGDGLLWNTHDESEGEATLALIDRMVDDLNALNQSGEDHCPPEYLAQTWHDDMAWYGPAGIGATFTIPRYQQQHQYPFRFGVQDKVYNGHKCRLAEGNYGGFFGWPNLTHRPVGGLLSLPGYHEPVDMRVVDIYRREGDKLAENWILIDFPWWLKQQGLDIFARLRDIGAS